jgi:hypothetical protein
VFCCLSIDVREWYRQGLLRAGQRFTRSWTRGGKASGSVDVRTEADAVILIFKPGGAEGNGSKPQRCQGPNCVYCDSRVIAA